MDSNRRPHPAHGGYGVGEVISVHCNLCGFVPGRTGGAQVFLEGLLPQMEKFDDVSVTVCGSAATRQWMNSFLGDGVGFEEMGADSPGVMNRFFATRTLRSFSRSGDIVWSPLNQGVGGLDKAKEVLTIHDLIPLHYTKKQSGYPPSFKRRFAFGLRWKNSMRIGRQAGAVVTVSDSNVDELQAALGGGKTPVYGAPNGINTAMKTAAAEKGWSYSGQSEVLAVTSGSLPHKGLKTLEQVAQAMPEVTFKVIGKVSTSANQKNIVQVGKVSIEELNDQYRSASALFFPSRIEGFGLPVLEATVFGTPVVATDIPVLREVGGPDSLYFEMDNIEAATAHLRTVIESKPSAETMSTNGKEYSRRFTWEKAAAIYRQVFQTVAN